MMAHDAFRRLAALAVDGPLTPDEDAELARHRFGCLDCERYESALRTDAVALESRLLLEPPAAVNDRVAIALADRWAPTMLRPVMVMLITALVVAGAVGASLAIGSYLRQEADLPSRPATPDGWTLALAYPQDIRVALPPYVVPFQTQGSIMANEDPAGNTSWLQVMAAGPGDTIQPANGESLETWVLNKVSTGPHDAVHVRNVLLPSGPSVEVRTTYSPGTPDETPILAYAISTPEGYAFLQISGRPKDFADHAADIALLPYLVETGPLLAANLGPPSPEVELVVDVPQSWFYQPGPVGNPVADDYTGFVSNVPIAPDMCEVDSEGNELCTNSDLGPDEFVVSVFHSRRGTPGIEPTSSPLPAGQEWVTVAGQPALRVIPAPETVGADRRYAAWTVIAHGSRTGYWLIALDAGSPDFQATLREVQAMLERSRFAPID